MLNLPNKFSIWYLVSGILLAFTLLLFLPPRPVYATCYCVNPTKDNCKCGSAPPPNATYPSNNAGVEVKCTSKAEANSVFENKNPICGSATETIPYCAPYKDGSGNYSCYGRSFAYGGIDQRIMGAPDGSWISNVGSFTFNGFSFIAKDVFVCDAGNFCCSPGENNPGCDDSNVPKGGSCTPQLSSVTPPVAICGGATNSPGESRLWFPHIRLIAALSTIAQALFNPKPSTLARNTAPSNRTPSLENPTVVTTRIEEHQGALDGTTVVNESDNNSSLIVGREAPAPLYTFGNTSDDNPYNDSAQCRIDNTYTNPGDDLVGPKVTGSLYYTQKYEYQAREKPAGCIGDGSPYPANRSRECCSGIYQSNLLCGKLEDVRIPTKGKIALFLKNPLVEYIYNSLVAGSDSLFKRFMPNDKTQDFEEIGSPVSFSASATSANHGDSQTELAVGGDTGADPTLYVPRLGSLKKYWLDDLQKALRPQGVGAQESIGAEEVSSSCPLGSPPYCSVENLLPYFDNNVTKATKASIICQKESGGFPFALNDGCLTGKSFDYSVGLFQYNLASSLNRCPGAFKSIDVAKKSCVIADKKKLDACVQELYDPVRNIQKAVALSGGGENWTDWAAAPACGIK